MVPALTREWAPRLVAAGEIHSGQRVLDVACGTGVLSREIVATVGPAGLVAGIDPDAGMLAVARRSASSVAWQSGSADALPYPDASFDAVVSQFGMMFFPDRIKAAIEMWRVLRPGGKLAVAVWASLADTPAYQIQVDLVERMAGTPAATVLRSPFCLGTAEVFGRVFSQAGITLDRLTVEPGRASFSSVRAMLEADLVEWLPATGIVLDRQLVERIIDAGETAFAPFIQRDGSVRFDSPAVVAVATKPPLM